MKNRISRLNEELVNQIAAGEVVERPASAIKEIVENSLDAQATRIEVLLKDGGVEEIAVIDNGVGIHPEDLPLSIERHATSKIARLEDLSALYSYGFRGEALAAISSVSDIEIRSRTPSMQEAIVLESQNGVLLPLRPVGAPAGTAVFIRRLFQRVPARLKFLRSTGTEFSYCQKIFKELALSTPSVSFSLSHNGKSTARFGATSALERFKEVVKPHWEPQTLEEENEGLALLAFLSPPELLQDRGELFVFINNRTVRSKLFVSAIRNAYLEIFGEGHDPSGALYLKILPEWVDVNVHPQKLEVRCLKQDRIYQWLFNVVRKSLAAQRPPAALFSAQDLLPNFSSGTESIAFLSVLGDRYLVREKGEALEIFHRRKLNARIWRSQLDQNVTVTPLPVPQILCFKPAELKLLLSLKDSFKNLGIEFEEYGDRDIAVTGLPTFLESARLEELFQAVIENPGETVNLLARFAPPLPLPVLLDYLKNLKEEWTGDDDGPILWRMPREQLEKHFQA